MGAYDPKPWLWNNEVGESRSYRVGMGPSINEPLHVYAIKGIQAELNYHGQNLAVDGSFGPLTDVGVRTFQESQKLVVDGLVGPNTLKKLFAVRICLNELELNIPFGHLCGLIKVESGFDPGAVGANGFDTGLAQLNLDIHPYSVEQAVDPAFSIPWAQQNLYNAYKKYQSSPDAWKIAIAHHNSPLAAKQWFNLGEPQTEFIDKYVNLVLTGC